MRKTSLKKIIIFLSTLLLVCLSGTALANWQMNMPEGVTPVSKDIYGLHMLVIWICVFIGVVVYGVMLYSIIMHRKSRGHEAAKFHEHPGLEIFWAVIPFIILVIMAIPATHVLQRMDDTSNADVTIKITGYQWKWQYEYLDQGIRFFSNLSTPINQIYDNAKKDQWYLLEVDKPLVVPTHKKIRFLVTSSDVNHSWWVPELGIKRDAIPGFIHESWAIIDKPGVYRGQCAELCGVNHGFMPIVVQAMNDDDFAKWAAKEEKVEEKETAATGKPEKQAANMTMAELMSLGKNQYDKYCAACHRPDGLGMPPVFPALKGSSVAVGNPISRHINMILKGVPGTAMQAFESQLTDKDIAAITTYERNAWDNDTGDVVQPADVAKVRQGNDTVEPTMTNNNGGNE